MQELSGIGLQLEQVEGLQQIAANFKSGIKQQMICGLNSLPRDIFLLYFQNKYFDNRPLLLLAEDDFKAAAWKRELEQYIANNKNNSFVNSGIPKIYYFPAQEMMFFDVYARSRELIRQRLLVESALLAGENSIIITSYDAVSRKLFAPEIFEQHTLVIDTNSIIDTKELAIQLTANGYERIGLVEGPGQFSIKGSIIDIYAIDADVPVRIELFGDEIDSLRSFAADTQRSLQELDFIRIPPAKEMLLNEASLTKGSQRLFKDFELQTSRLLKSEKRAAAENCRKRRDSLLEQLNNGILDQNFEDFLYYFLDNKNICLLDYLPPQTLVVIDEPVRLQESAELIFRERSDIFRQMLQEGHVLPEQMGNYLDWHEFQVKLQSNQILWFSLLLRQPSFVQPEVITSIQCARVNDFQGHWQIFCSEVHSWHKRNFAVLIVAAREETAQRIQKLLQDEGLFALCQNQLNRVLQPGEIVVVSGEIDEGFEIPQARLVVITEYNLFGHPVKNKRMADRFVGKGSKLEKGQPRGLTGDQDVLSAEDEESVEGIDARLEPFVDLQPGDYIVHNVHGIGRFLGIETLEVAGTHKDYLSVQYAGTDHLYLPVDQMDMIQKYIGSEGNAPRLSRFGGREWARVKQKVRDSLCQMADELVQLYAARSQTRGFSFRDEPAWEAEFAARFPYEETKDQLKAIKEISADMRSERAMDRLLCGDVGYGKTEVAMRAAFKAVLNSKQVAVLVPTTILAQQHYNNFRERFQPFGIGVDMLSRFKSAAEQKKIINDLAEGKIDIVIGTHSLLGKRVRFKDLGLLIIDEEQRFGVNHKEKLKQLRLNVDVLTLTATPIPRTLHMALTGIREMSTLITPPENRLPVRTFVTEEDPALLREVIRKELNRGGQIYFVTNRVNDIEHVSERLHNLVPEARVAVAHGQMDERMLEKIMLQFMQGEYDVLLCTTIIENGLDIANVNTLIVRNSQQLGLSQLYQLRGRVGRTNCQAFAYFTYKRDGVLNEDAEKRLAAIREFTEFGSGFKIAMRDLEIRGAGNVLGAAQHGHIAAVGYHMFTKLLEEAVQEAKMQQKEGTAVAETVVKDGENKTAVVQNKLDIQPAAAITIDLNIDAYIDGTYISDVIQKITMYKKIAAVCNESELQNITDELIDRYGTPPQETVNLLQIAQLKLLAVRAGINNIEQKGPGIIVSFDVKNLPGGEKIARFHRRFPRLIFSGSDGLKIKLKVVKQNNEMIMTDLQKIIAYLT